MSAMQNTAVVQPNRRKSLKQWVRSMRGQQILVTLVFLFVPLLLLITFTYLPFFKMVQFNFFNMRYIGRRTFVGLQNYIDVFTRDDIFHALTLSLYYMAGSVIQMALALLFATLLSFKTKGSKFFRGALYFPCLICVLVGSIMISSMLAYVLNRFKFPGNALIRNLFKVEDTYYIIWCQDFYGASIGIARTQDFKTFTRVENPFVPFNRNAVLFPRKSNGMFTLLSRPSDSGHTPFGDIFLSQSPDMEFWGPPPPCDGQKRQLVGEPEDRRRRRPHRDQRRLAAVLPRRHRHLQRLCLLHRRRHPGPRRAQPCAAPLLHLPADPRDRL